MKANQLYHFIKGNTSSIQKNATVPFQAEAIGSFIKVALQKPNDLNLLSITLPEGTYNFEAKENAHATFYDTLSASNPTLSEYHYTAYFTEKDHPGSDFQLHVYFNNKDQLTTKPQLKECREDGTTRFILLGDAEAIFQFLALKYTHEIMVPIRLSLREKLGQDKLLYAEMTQVLDELSKDRDQNFEPYLAEIRRHLLFLEDIIPYQSNQPAFAGIRTILNYHASIVKEKAQSSTQPTKYKASSDDAGVALGEEGADREVLVIHTNTRAPSKAVRQDLSISVQAAKEAMDLYAMNRQSSSLQESAVFLSSAIQLTQEASLYSMDMAYEKSPADLLILQRLLFVQEQHKEELIEHLLLSDHLTEAGLLLGHWKEDGCSLSLDIACRLMSRALEQGRDQLLAFILDKTDFPINTFTMKSEMGQVTAAMHCFLKNSPSAATCLSVLISHGASLMEPCPRTGLPLAHRILSEKHPAMLLALKENREKTLANFSFFAQLIRLLKAQPATEEIRNSIRTYENLLHVLGLQRDKSAIALQQNQKICVGVERLLENPEFVSQPNLRLLQSDPEFRIKYEELKLHQEIPLAKTRNSDMQRKIPHLVGDLLELLQENPDVLNKPYDVFKKECLEDLQAQIDALKLYERGNKTLLTEGKRPDKETKDLQRRLGEYHQTRKEQGQEELKKAKNNQRAYKHLGKQVDLLQNLHYHLEEGMKAMNFITSNVESFSKSEITDVINALDAFQRWGAIETPASEEHTECDRDDDDRMRKQH